MKICSIVFRFSSLIFAFSLAYESNIRLEKIADAASSKLLIALDLVVFAISLSKNSKAERILSSSFDSSLLNASWKSPSFIRSLSST